MIPEPQVSEQARLIVMAVVYWTVIVGLVTIVACTYLNLAHDPPAVPRACVVTQQQRCPIETQNGWAEVYWSSVYKVPDVATVGPTRTPGRAKSGKGN